jgi:1-acyl-sn-glycerol-3-phosphate acyltransferase
MLPLIVGLEVLLLVTAPLTLFAAVLAALATGSSRPLRTVLLVLAYAGIELRLLRRITGPEPRWDTLVPDVAGIVYRTLNRVLDVRVELEPGSAEPAAVTGNPVLVLARHCGPGDSLFLAWLIEVHYRLRLHLVLKALLRLEPALDLAADHLPLCFVRPGHQRARAGIEELAATMTAGDALLLFPEGGNFSRPRWQRAVLTRSFTGRFAAARRARNHTHTLPPHHGGTTAALTGAPAADVLLLAHSGFADDGRDRPWWRLPVHRTLLVRTKLVPAAEVPREEAAVAAWLDEVWAEVDDWVAAHGVPAATPAPEPPEIRPA